MYTLLALSPARWTAPDGLRLEVFPNGGSVICLSVLVDLSLYWHANPLSGPNASRNLEALRIEFVTAGRTRRLRHAVESKGQPPSSGSGSVSRRRRPPERGTRPARAFDPPVVARQAPAGARAPAQAAAVLREAVGEPGCAEGTRYQRAGFLALAGELADWSRFSRA